MSCVSRRYRPGSATHGSATHSAPSRASEQGELGVEWAEWACSHAAMPAALQLPACRACCCWSACPGLPGCLACLASPALEPRARLVCLRPRARLRACYCRAVPVPPAPGLVSAGASSHAHAASMHMHWPASWLLVHQLVLRMHATQPCASRACRTVRHHITSRGDPLHVRP